MSFDVAPFKNQFTAFISFKLPNKSLNAREYVDCRYPTLLSCHTYALACMYVPGTVIHNPVYRLPSSKVIHHGPNNYYNTTNQDPLLHYNTTKCPAWSAASINCSKYRSSQMPVNGT